MNLKRTIALLILFVLPIALFFSVLCTIVSFFEAENLPALVVFIPSDILLLLLLRWCIRTLRGDSRTTYSKTPQEDTVICWDCGGRNKIHSPKTGKCQYCGANLHKHKKNPYL